MCSCCVLYMSKQSFASVCLKVYYQTPPMIGEALANPSDFCCKLWKHWNQRSVQWLENLQDVHTQFKHL